MRSVLIIGVGPGAPDQVTYEAVQAMRQADYFVVADKPRPDGAAAYEQVLRDHDGDAGFLVWGDPAFYDSTRRVLEKVRTRLEFDLEVIPGISSIQLLAARHRIVLHDGGRPIHVTTGRALAESIAQGQDNVVVMLNRGLDPLHDPELADWLIWWGANLGSADEALVAGRVSDVLGEIDRRRRTTRGSAGWLMDIYLLRRVI